MEITLPAGCGNAPRIGIVSDFTAAWAKSDQEAVSEALSPDAEWMLVGETTSQHVGARVFPAFTPDRIELLSVITHGRFASCDGYIESGRKRLSFSHSIRFTNTAKSAKIAEIRSYLIET